MARDTRTEQSSTFWPIVRETALVIALSLVIATIVRIFLVQAFLIPSQSMEDTLEVDDRVLVSKLSTRFGDVERGDIVVFEDPNGWLGLEAALEQPGLRGAISDALEFVGVLPSSAEGHLIKRVIAVGGDVVECCDPEGRVIVNGQPVDEPYLFPGDEPSSEPFDVEVPEGELWVMGDHRSNSGDSRVHGTVPEDRVVGKAFLVVWPFSRAQVLNHTEAFDAVPDDPPATIPP